MKYSLLALSLLYSTITIAMEQKKKRIHVQAFRAQRDGNRIVASGIIKDQQYSVEKDLKNKTVSVSRMVSVEGIHTKGIEFHPVDNQPEVTTAFKRRINTFQKQANNLQQKKSAPSEQSKNPEPQPQKKSILRQASGKLRNFTTTL
jgi:hypothetical protein